MQVCQLSGCTGVGGEGRPLLCQEYAESGRFCGVRCAGDAPFEAGDDLRSIIARLPLQSLTQPVAVYEEDVRTGERSVLKRTPVPGVDLAAYESQRLWATAADGTSVPVDASKTTPSW